MCLSVNNCCCCFNLDVGTKIIGVLSTLLALIMTTVYGWSAMLGAELPPSRQWFYGAMAAAALMQSIFGCLLIYGAFTHKAKYTVPWAALAWSTAAVLAALAVAGTVLLSYNHGQQTTAAISAVISIYFVYARTSRFWHSPAATAARFARLVHGLVTIETMLVATLLATYSTVLFFYFASVVFSRRQQMLLEEQTQASKRLMRHRVLPNYYV